MGLNERINSLIVEMNDDVATFYAISYENEELRYLLSEIAIIYGKRETEAQYYNEPRFAPDNNNRFLNVDGVYYLDRLPITRGPQKGLILTSERMSLYEDFSKSVIGFIQSPAKLKTLFEYRKRPLYKEVLSCITKEKLCRVSSDALDEKIAEMFPGNWEDRSKLKEAFLRQSQIINAEHIQEFDSITDSSNKKVLTSKHKGAIIIDKNLGI